MKPIPAALLPAFRAEMARAAVPPGKTPAYEKWLRYYLDFCFKYQHPPRDIDSLQPFLHKLASKHQPPVAQEQAAHSISLYRQAVKSLPRSQPVVSHPAAHEPQLRHKDTTRSQVLRENADLSDEPAGVPGDDGMVGKSPHPADAWEDLYRQLKEQIRVRQYSPKTLGTYRTWTRQFQLFLGPGRSPSDLTAEDAARYLTHLAAEQHVAASTQNQAFNALLFVYRHILKVDYDLRDKVVRARRTRYIPVVLTRKEVDLVLSHLENPSKLVVSVLYGCGLRMFEGLNLRVGCLNFDDRMVTVHDGKGRKDRTVPMPEALVPALQEQIQRVMALHEEDLQVGYAGVFMPYALDRKWKNSGKRLEWQWVFPAQTLTFVPDQGEHRRYHMHESVFQRALRAAVLRARIPKRVTAHTFRHSFASHLLLNNYDIRTIQEMLGHSDVRTTMIYTHTVQSRTLKERKSPLDF